MQSRRRAVLYLRLSVTSEESTSITRQERDLRALAEREGWDVVDVLVDDGVSGGKRRPKADAALRAIEEGRADVLAVWKFDRWSRQGLGAVVDLLDVLETREKAGAEALFVALHDGLRSGTTAWRMQVAISAEVGRMEREAIRARVTSSVDHLRRVGRFPGGRVPYGYRTAPHPDGSGRVLEIDPDAASEIRRWADGVLAGRSLYSLTKDTPTSLDTARGVLVGEAVLGRVVHRGDVLRDAHGLPLAVWPAILTVEESHSLRALLARQKRGQGRRKASALLSGMAYCGSCNGVMYAAAGHYRCVPTRGRTCEAPVRVKADLVEAEVVGQLLSAVGDLPYFEERILATEPAELAQIEEAISATTTALGRDDADMAGLVERLVALKARREELRSRPSAPETRIVATGETYREHWEASDNVAARRALLTSAVEYVAVSKAPVWSPERVTVGWRLDGAEDYDAV